MSAGVIIAIVVIAVIILAVLAFALPRARARRHEQYVVRRRQAVAGAHREAADERFARAEVAEREARVQRAEAELHQSEARLHDHGAADDRLDEPIAEQPQRFRRGQDVNGDGQPGERRDAAR
jgi:biopolymer transport protein ExbB/TolQ